MIDIRDFGIGRHKSVDDTPAGGGAGMVMLPGPVLEMLDEQADAHKVLLSPKGTPFTQSAAERLSRQAERFTGANVKSGAMTRAGHCTAF